MLGVSPSCSFKSRSHQQFVDDTILMGTSSIKESSTMKNHPKIYSSASGHMINWEKSYILFFNTLEDRQNRMAQILGCQIGKPPSIYLGLPLGTKPMDLFWNTLVDIFSRKLAGWKGSLLSRAGKINLLKSSLQSLPIYSVSIFKILGKFTDAIQKIQKDLVWYGVEKKKRVSLVTWKNVCKPKKLGGLGLKNIRTLNKTLLAKQIWEMERGMIF